MLDGLPINSKFGDENFDDMVALTYGSLDLNMTYIDSNNEASTIINKGYQKYCKGIPPSFQYRFTKNPTSKLCSGMNFSSCLSIVWSIENNTWNYLMKDPGGSFCYAYDRGITGWYCNSSNNANKLYAYGGTKTITCDSIGENTWYK